ncbi:hypothetical protein VZ95_15695 [Elstera litoralis]|uniref:Prolyl 4-hydroxylase alpha subunit Fe(2+) 2OG dioxygenase domain-containing protein n=1 Tax=Elstera litoralis TaxID=552518 RepID=A0A0F3IQD9_9PROT|nr:hypothetical protein [Elstera litoralis]KJV08758.1 hypothetical protein VZ95_15695 [Elstera litoralis]
MSDHALEKQTVLYNILNTPRRPWPHGHSYISPVFSEPFYDSLRAHLPPAEAYTPLGATGKAAEGDYGMRSGFLLDAPHKARVSPAVGDFWQSLFDRVFDAEFAETLVAHFREAIDARLAAEGAVWPTSIKRDMILVRDASSDGVKIHTSDPKNLITLLFYLPEDARYAPCGTTLYLPKQRDFRCWGGPHHGFADFDKVWTAPFLPNSLYMFVKSDDSFHGVEPIQIEGMRRDLLLFYVHR